MAQIEQRRFGPVLKLTIDRPEKKNALTNEMYGALADALEMARHDASVRCVVMTGAGDTFTAGHDIPDFAAVAQGTLDQAERNVHRVLRLLGVFEKPLIAAVPGLAIGIGMTILLHCDLVFLAETAMLSAPFVDLALVPEAASSLLLQERIGYARSFAMFALGQRIDAPSALDWGLANAIMPVADLQTKAMEAAEALAMRPPGAIIATKRLMRDAQRIAARMKEEELAFEARLQTPEAREAFTAFAERRKPDYARF